MTNPPLPQAIAPGACPMCGTPPDPGAAFCEACGADLTPATGTGAATPASRASDTTVVAAATPNTAAAGEESPLDVGWTGPVASAKAPEPAAQTCPSCGEGTIVDGYCDTCGAKPPDPRNHFVETPAPWVGGVCDIGKRHHRNEDAMALAAWGDSALATDARAVLVVCDGVTMATDSHIASLAAAHTARTLLSQPTAQGVGTPDSWAMAAQRALTTAAEAANRAVVDSVPETVDEPPSCTFVAALVQGNQAVVGNIGDSRAYWLPDADDQPPTQLGRDDSYAQEQIEAGVERKQAETGENAHSITRWLGRDAPEDLTPHLQTVDVSAPGWLALVSDGLWNYCSDAAELATLVRDTAAVAGSKPTDLAGALVAWANAQGGRDNITVALARCGADPAPVAPAAPDRGTGEAESQSTGEPAAAPAGPAS